MKNRLLYILFLLATIALLMSCSRKIDDHAKSKLSESFVADSGYILKQEGIAFLLKVKGKDTIDVNSSSLKDTDTIGKYYKTKTGNYIACVLDIIHPNQNSHPVLFEYTPIIGKILKHENFYSSNYLCCWDNNYEGFQKHGDYYSIKTCGTGSGFCSGSIYLFKELEPQSESIPATAWSILCVFQPDEASALACSLTSTMSIKSDIVTMHYKLKHIAFEGQDDEIQKIKDTEFFDIKYIKKEIGWIAVDSTNISKIPG